MLQGETLRLKMESFIEELPAKVESSQFLGAIKIFTEKPHVINRRICGTVNLWIGINQDNFSRKTLVKSLNNILGFSLKKPDLSNKSQEQVLPHREPELIGEQTSGNINDVQYLEEHEFMDDTVVKIKEVLCIEGFKKVDQKSTQRTREDLNLKYENFNNKQIIPWHLSETNAIAVIRKIIPKQLEKLPSIYEVVISERSMASVMYMGQSTRPPAICPSLPYALRHTHTGVTLSCFTEENIAENNSGILWVQKKVLPKIIKWASEVSKDGKVDDNGSLRLIDVQQYNQLYSKLKMKYGKHLVEMWPETTDPLKYVYEDISIAAYLLLLWRQERVQKGLTESQTFVDLGCGNGLLVYILSGEGHQGMGVDIKKRNIWDMFSPSVLLQEGTVEPSDKNLFPKYDWLIGNHSDELTPWLPVIAAKSSHTTRFFVIPCCAYDFDCKYRRRCAGRSQYSDYLQYINEVGTVCGFQVWQDKLRIPSTKRICIIGQERTYSEDNTKKIVEGIDSFIKQREKLNRDEVSKQETQDHTRDSQNEENDCGLWSNNFKAREAVQPVRNCTQLKKSVREDLILTVANMLMKKQHIIMVEVREKDFVEWDRGGTMTMGDIAQTMTPQQRLALKNECGGLQTLLKNHKYIFSLMNGEVSLQSPIPVWKATVPSDKIKTKLCWYYNNHKKGCPLPATLCIFAHGDEDLK